MSAFFWSALAIAAVFGVLWLATRLTVLVLAALERRRRWTRGGPRNPRLWH